MLSCVNLGLELNNKKIFSGVSLSLLPGSIYILKGDNGSGKTSLLKIIAGLSKDHEGEILWNNKSLNHDDYYKYLVLGFKKKKN